MPTTAQCVFYKNAYMGIDVADYFIAQDAGVEGIGMGGGINTVGFDREMSEINSDTFLSVGLWCNLEDYQDCMPHTLGEDSQVVLHGYDHMRDIWISDVLFTGSALDCINWMVAEDRMNEVCAKYAPIMRKHIESGESGNLFI